MIPQITDKERKLAAENERLREAARMGLDWIEAHPEPRMIGALKAITALKEALGEQG